MNDLENLLHLNNAMLDEMPHYQETALQFSHTLADQARLFRSLMNVRPPMPLSSEFIELHDEYLQNQAAHKGIVSLGDLRPFKTNSQLYLWQGDITRLALDGIVNAANSALLGCFVPCHGCIDNAIHSAAGLQLRQACSDIMQKQGHEEYTGFAKITDAYNLPSKYVIHTVGPIIKGTLNERDCTRLADSYQNCLKLAQQHNLESLAFCCISTGEFRFPPEKAAEIATHTVQTFLHDTKSKIKVVFNVFKDQDYVIYRQLLGEDF